MLKTVGRMWIISALMYTDYVCTTNPCICRLIETMVDHADGSLKKYEDTFPEDLTLGQVVAVWKEIAVASQETKVIVD